MVRVLKLVHRAIGYTITGSVAEVTTYDPMVRVLKRLNDGLQSCRNRRRYNLRPDGEGTETRRIAPGVYTLIWKLQPTTRW